jgi:gamma-butyrobetaine dioxygenase
MKRFGLALIDNLDDTPQSGEKFGDLMGFKRESNFGVMFDVINKANANNLAYTSIALPLHTDLPNQELVPGYQFLHCFKNSTTGGASVLADGLAILEDFKRDYPQDFALLCTTNVPWRFHDETCDIRRERPVIDLDASGNLRNFTFNGHIADVICLPEDQIYAFYHAYQTLMRRIRSDAYSIRHTLQPGEMIIFDNRRVMHGRDSFDQTAGDRHLRGFYIDHNEVDSKLRVLAREQETKDSNA